MQDNDSIMCEHYCIVFIIYMVAGKTLSDYTDLFSLNDYKKNYKKYISILRTNMSSLKSRL